MENREQVANSRRAAPDFGQGVRETVVNFRRMKTATIPITMIGKEAGALQVIGCALAQRTGAEARH